MVSTVVRDKKVKALRYLLRRKQCSLVLIIEGILLIILFAFGLSFVFVRDKMARRRQYLREQDERIATYKNNVTFAHCPLKLVQKPEGVNDFALAYCKNRAGRVAFAYRHYHLDEDNTDKTCLSVTEQVMCHEHMMDGWKLYTELPATGPKCPGKKSDWNSNVPTMRRRVPMQLNPSLQKNLILHAAQLVVECPVCVAAGATRSGNNTCEIDLSTKTNGWPWHHEKCSDFSKLSTNVTELCNSVSTTKKPLTSTQVPVPAPNPVNLVHDDDDFFDEAY